MTTAARIKRAALLVLMAALVAGAAMAIVVLVAEPGGDVPARVLGTAGFLALGALTGLCAALAIERGILPGLGIAGIVVSVAAFGLGLAYVWGLVDPGGPADIRPLGAVVLVAIALAWLCLLALLLRRTPLITAAVVLAMLAVTGLTGLLLAQAFGAAPEPGIRMATAVAAILAALGSFLGPMLAGLRRLAAAPSGGP